MRKYELALPQHAFRMLHINYTVSVFQVPAGTLAFSVTIYTICAILCIAVLVLRRFLKATGNAELGGKFEYKIATFVFFIILWVMYVLLSCMQTYGDIKVNF